MTIGIYGNRSEWPRYIRELADMYMGTQFFIRKFISLMLTLECVYTGIQKLECGCMEFLQTEVWIYGNNFSPNGPP